MGVSIIACTYNDSGFLSKCIPTCFDQNIEKEVILVDDASTTPLDPWIKEAIGRLGIKYIRHDQNSGLSSSRNTGIRAAKYDYVIPIDADDWFYPNTIRTLYDARETFDVVGGNCTDNGIYKPSISHGPLTKETFIANNPLVCSSLFRKSIWDKVGGYMVRQGPHYEDWNFWARCFAAGGTFKYIDFEVYNHTSRADSMLRILHPNGDFYRRLATEGVFK